MTDYRIPDGQEALDALYRKYAPPSQEKAHANGHAAPRPSPERTDAEILKLARNAKNAARFAALYDDGDTSRHDGDQNRADMALLALLAFYTQNPDQPARLFKS